MLFELVNCNALIEDLMRRHHDGVKDHIVLMEECAELPEAVTRVFNPDWDVNVERIAEEMAHVYAMMNLVALRLEMTPAMLQKAIDKERKELVWTI